MEDVTGKYYVDTNDGLSSLNFDKIFAFIFNGILFTQHREKIIKQMERQWDSNKFY